MPQRGPKRLEYIPEKYRGIRGIEHLTTQDQLKKLAEYIDKEDRKPFVRLGCSTPQRPSVILRQTIKRILPLLPKGSISKEVREGKDLDVMKGFLQETSDNTSFDKKVRTLASRALARVEFAETNKSVQSSTWAVDVDGTIEVVYKSDIDPRSAYKWMNGSNRAWNLAAATF